MREPKSRNELRCFCRRRPLLAVYGLDALGSVYVHIKVYKNRRIYGEVLVMQGSKISIHCRECLRWYTLEVGTSSPKLVETPPPDSIAQDTFDAPMVETHSEHPLR